MRAERAERAGGLAGGHSSQSHAHAQHCTECAKQCHSQLKCALSLSHTRTFYVHIVYIRVQCVMYSMCMTRTRLPSASSAHSISELCSFYLLSRLMPPLPSTCTLYSTLLFCIVVQCRRTYAYFRKNIQYYIQFSRRRDAIVLEKAGSISAPQKRSPRSRTHCTLLFCVLYSCTPLLCALAYPPLAPPPAPLHILQHTRYTHTPTANEN